MRQEELYLGLGEEDCVVGAESQWQEMEPAWWWAQSGWQQTSRPHGGLKSGRRRAGAVSGGAQGVGEASGRPQDEVALARHRATRPARRAGLGRSTTTRGGARGRGTAEDPRAAGDGGGGARGQASRGRGRRPGITRRRSELCEVWERRGFMGECSVSAG